MPLFRYLSFNRHGKKISGTVDAASLETAKEVLRMQGLLPVELEPAEHSTNTSFFSKLLEVSIPPESVVVLTRQMAVMLKNGIPLLKVIEMLVDQSEGRLRRILIEVKDDVKEGVSFADALEKHHRVFSSVYCQLVRAGEASGKLDIILGRLTGHLERSNAIKKKISKALAYPIFLLSFAVSVIVGIVTFIIPPIADMFIKSNVELPGITKAMLTVSSLFSGYWPVLLVSSIALLIGFIAWKKTAYGQHVIDKIFIKTPIVKKLSKTKAVVQFSQTLGMLLEGGVNLSESLRIVCNVVDNGILKKSLNEARDSIIKEGKIAKHLKETGIFPPIATYMISTGEQSGSLGSMLLSVGKDYEEELTETIDRLIDKIPKVMTFVMAGVVLLIILSIFLPITQMGQIAGI
ncbi:type II secretion system F family protein [bacterium]|jgi:type II secretory pathway component PulF|nr:type II secretion system F family protein [bacterium]